MDEIATRTPLELHRFALFQCQYAGFNGFYNNVLDVWLTIFFTLEAMFKAIHSCTPHSFGACSGRLGVAESLENE